MEGYVLVPADGVMALWHENEHLKRRLADLQPPARHLLCACANPFVVCAVHP